MTVPCQSGAFHSQVTSADLSVLYEYNIFTQPHQSALSRYELYTLMVPMQKYFAICVLLQIQALYELIC